jgi:hypothetical protein
MMNTPLATSATFHTFDLLTYYSLETEHYPQVPTKVQVLDHWLKTYSEQWVRLALIESLYQGRYKAFSVEQLLLLWSRRGQPVYHFNAEFEELVCHDVPRQMDKAVMPPKGAGTTQRQKVRPNVKLEPISNPPELNLSSHAAFQAPKVEASPINSGVQGDVQDLSEDPWGEVSGAGMASMLDLRTMLPVTVGRLGLVPILQFMPEAQPIEFCEKLEAIARPQD